MICSSTFEVGKSSLGIFIKSSLLKDINGRTSMDADIPLISLSHVEAKNELSHETGVLGISLCILVGMPTLCSLSITHTKHGLKHHYSSEFMRTLKCV